MKSTTRIPTPTETRSATPHKTVWVTLPGEPRSEREADEQTPVYDPSAIYEECERWDGMA